MKNYDQSSNATENYLRQSELAQIMIKNKNKAFTKEELCGMFHKGERSMREALAELGNYAPVVSLCSNKGYKVVGFDENTTKEQKVELANEIQHQLNDYESRIENLHAREKPLIALLKVLEKDLIG